MTMTKTIYNNTKPYHWVTPETETVLQRGYLLPGETPQDAVRRVTTAAANRLDRPDLQPKFEALVANGWMSLSSPVWANMGTDRGCRSAALALMWRTAWTASPRPCPSAL